VQQGPLEFGLIRRSDKPWLATLVDGFMEINAYSTIHPTAVEIKTMSGATTLAEARTIGTQLNKLSLCRFGDQVFKKGVNTRFNIFITHVS